MPEQLSMDAVVPPAVTEDARGVRFVSLPTRSVLNRCDSPRMPFRWTLNPYRGCEFGCRYCYARYTHEFLGADPAAFETEIRVKQDVVPALRRDLGRVVPGEPIAIGTATDPYQPAERTHELMRGVLEVFVGRRGHDLSITTKSRLVLRDLDLLRAVARHNRVCVNVSLISLDEDLVRRLEPRAPRPALRLEVIRRVREAGLPVGLFLMPILPGLTDDADTLRSVVDAAAAEGAGFVVSGLLFLREPTRSFFLDWLEDNHPEWIRAYRAGYGRSSHLTGAYGDAVRETVRRVRRIHRLPGRPRRRPDGVPPAHDRAPGRPPQTPTAPPGLAAPRSQLGLVF